jgi:hypothetical protein
MLFYAEASRVLGEVDRLQTAKPEPLESSFTITPGMLMAVLDRPGNAWEHLRALLLDNHDSFVHNLAQLLRSKGATVRLAWLPALAVPLQD